MKKHIKVRAEVISSTEVRVTLLEQTHFGTNFGCIDHYKNSECKWSANESISFSFGSVRLISQGGSTVFGLYQDVYGERSPQVTTWIILKPVDKEQHIKMSSFTFPVKLWSSAKAAIEAYNEYFKE